MGLPLKANKPGELRPEPHGWLRSGSFAAACLSAMMAWHSADEGLRFGPSRPSLRALTRWKIGCSRVSRCVASWNRSFSRFRIITDIAVGGVPAGGFARIEYRSVLIQAGAPAI